MTYSLIYQLKCAISTLKRKSIEELVFFEENFIEFIFYTFLKRYSNKLLPNLYPILYDAYRIFLSICVADNENICQIFLYTCTAENWQTHLGQMMSNISDIRK